MMFKRCSGCEQEESDEEHLLAWVPGNYIDKGEFA